MMALRNMILVGLLLACSGCADFLVNTSGTFVGNIISNKVIKEMEKDKTSDTRQEIPKKAI
jgi:hypothetical protein